MRHLDSFDRTILNAMQSDSSLSIDEIADRTRLSRNACWRRIKKLDEDGVIRSRVALLDPQKLNLGLTAFIAIRTTHHEPGWLKKFAAAVQDLPEIIGVYRTTGETDYLLHAVVSDIAGYDRLYKKLISRVSLTDVAASFVMEKIKETTALPLEQIVTRAS